MKKLVELCLRICLVLDWASSSIYSTGGRYTAISVGDLHYSREKFLSHVTF